MKRKKNKQGYYEIRRTVPPYKDKNGKVHTNKKFYGRTIKEAEAKCEKYLVSQNAELLFFGDLLEDFITNNFSVNPKYKDSTKKLYIEAYRNNLENLPIMGKRLSDINYMDFQEAYGSMTCRPSGVRNCSKLVTIFFKFAVRQGLVPRDPSDGISLPKPAKKTEKVIRFSEEEVALIEAYIRKDASSLPYYERRRLERLKFLMVLALNTGLRSAELLALTYDDFTSDSVIVNKQLAETLNSSKLTIATPKSSASYRTVPLNADTAKVFGEHREWQLYDMKRNGYETNYIFTTSKGTFYAERSLRHTLDRIHEDIGVPQYGLHTYRRTFASRLAEKDTDPYTLAALLGHDSIETTNKYYVGISSKQKTNAVARLNEK